MFLASSVVPRASLITGHCYTGTGVGFRHAVNGQHNGQRYNLVSGIGDVQLIAVAQVIHSLLMDTIYRPDWVI